MKHPKWSTRDFLWATALIAIALAWLVDRGRLQLELKRAVDFQAKLAARLDSTERYSNEVQRLMELEHNWLREHHPEIIGMPRATPAAP